MRIMQGLPYRAKVVVGFNPSQNQTQAAKATVRYGLDFSSPDDVADLAGKKRVKKLARKKAKDDRIHMLEEALDVRLMRIQLRALGTGAIEQDKKGRAFLGKKARRLEFIEDHLGGGRRVRRNADDLLEALVDKINHIRKTRPLDHLPPQVYYALKAGDELRELIQEVEGESYPERSDLPKRYRRHFPLMLELTDELFDRAEKGDTIEDLKEHGLKKIFKKKDGQLKMRKRFRDELEDATDFAKAAESGLLNQRIKKRKALAALAEKTEDRANPRLSYRKRKNRMYDMLGDLSKV